jgi:hypothetical protein
MPSNMAYNNAPVMKPIRFISAAASPEFIATYFLSGW